ncbi:MAG: uL22 family ribosomal protein [Candidatus ainarchaeum sp.]|nr:uL22 family ribosomal protein [Candidatus ainarchaeum sp.]
MYSCIIEKGKEGDFARSRVEGVDASVKDLVEVCGNIRYKPVGDALALLEAASEGAFPILYRGNNRHLGHRRELGGRKGRYPKKSAKIVLKALKSAIANAQSKGLSEELIVMHACANKKAEFGRLSSKGRRNYSGLITARVEIVLKEKEGAKRPEKKAKKEAKPAEKKADAKVATEKPATGEAKPVTETEKPPTPEKKAGQKADAQAVKAEVRADDRKLESARESKVEHHKEEKAPLPGRKPVQKGK